VTQALLEYRTDVTQLRCSPYLGDAHRGLYSVIPEIVFDPYPGAVSLFLPLGVEVAELIADVALGVLDRCVVTRALDVIIQ